MERIAGQAAGIADRQQRLDAAVRPVALRDGNRAVERDHRRRRDGDQAIVGETISGQSVSAAVGALICAEAIAAST